MSGSMGTVHRSSSSSFLRQPKGGTLHNGKAKWDVQCLWMQPQAQLTTTEWQSLMWTKTSVPEPMSSASCHVFFRTHTQGTRARNCLPNSCLAGFMQSNGAESSCRTLELEDRRQRLMGQSNEWTVKLKSYEAPEVTISCVSSLCGQQPPPTPQTQN